jgi:Cof subfamily protein (haloacid dehalogenase superfamily)
MHNIRLIALDLDDTLLRSDKTISQETLDLLARWRSLGHHIAIATGRPPRAVAESLPPAYWDVPWICYNGGEVRLNGEIIYEDLLPVAETHQVLELVLACVPDCTIGMEIDNVIYFNRPVERVSPYEVADLFAVATRPSAKVLFYHHDFSTLESMLAEIPPRARALLSSKYKLVQILSHTADKATALQFLTARLGLTMQQVMAFGDDSNDVDMVRISGIGVAVANAIPEVKAVASRHTLSNDEDGVALVLHELLAVAASHAA